MRQVRTLQVLLWSLFAVLVTTAIVLATGCTNHWVIRPRQVDAESIVWRQTYGEANRVPPVSWVRMGLDCAHGTGWTSGGACISGWFSASDWSAAIAWPDGVVSFVPTSYAHELLHAHLYATTGDQDDAHARIEWSTLLPAANAALGKAGL